VKFTKSQFKQPQTPLFLNPTRTLIHLLKNPISAYTLFKKPYQEEFTTTLLQEMKCETNTPDRGCRNLPKTDRLNSSSTSHQALEPNKNMHTFDFGNLSRTNANSL